MPRRVFFHRRWVSSSRPPDEALTPGYSRTARRGSSRDSDGRGTGGAMNSHRVSQTRGLTAIDGAMALIVLLLVVQMWLLTATLDAYLAGHGDAALPGAVIS